jgi:uncharacterized membrane protein
MPPVLAHGALGAFDEVIFIMVIAIFVALMGISWVKSRMTEVEFDDEDAVDVSPTDTPTDQPDHFKLD